MDRFMCAEAWKQCHQLIANPLWRRGLWGTQRVVFSL